MLRNGDSFLAAAKKLSPFRNILKYLRPGKRNHRVHDAARRTDPLPRSAHDDLLVNRIQNNSGCHVSGELLNGKSPAGSNVPVIIDAPCANRPPGAATDNPALRRINLERVDASHAALRSLDHCSRRRISAGGPIKNQHRTTTVDEQEVMNRIYTDRRNAPDFRVGPAEDSFGSHISIRVPRKYQNTAGSNGKDDLIINRVHAHLIESAVCRTQYLSMGSLDDANGPFFSVSPSPEYQDRLCQRTRHNDFIVHRIVCKAVHGPADQSLLAFQNSNGRRILLRQPGEDRNLRMSHSVRHQYLFAFTVVGDGLSLAEFQRSFAERRTADRAYRRDVAIGG